ncbi:MAG: ABC transporter permease, partial [Spirochaetaceae bacterium]|nr:ABC transporter permease [Spirochaetaceae bacterium]
MIPLKRKYHAASFSALAAALLVSLLTMALLSDTPFQAIGYLLSGPLKNPMAIGNLLESAARLTLAGLAASLAFKSGLFNLGGEGQVLAGGLAAAAVALYLPGLPRFLALPASLAAGLITGAVIGGFSGLLRVKWGVDELISSFLVSASMGPVGHVLLNNVMKDPESYLIAAPPLTANYRLTALWPPSRLSFVLGWAILSSVLAFLFFRFTRRGYEWRLRAANEQFARYGGIRTGSIAVISLSVSGALYAAAGTAALMDGGQAIQGFTAGLGWDGLAIALIAGSRPEIIPLAALAYSWLIYGTQAAMMNTGFPFALSGMVQATVFLFVTARHFSVK